MEEKIWLMGNNLVLDKDGKIPDWNTQPTLKQKVEALKNCKFEFDEPYLAELLNSAIRHFKNAGEFNSFYNAENIINRMYNKYCC